MSVRWQRPQVTDICIVILNHCQTCSLFSESMFVIWLAYAGDRLEIDKPSSTVRWSLAQSAMTASMEWEMGQSDKWSTDNGLSPARQCVLFLRCLWSWLAPLARTQWCWEVLAGICETGQSLERCSSLLNTSCHVMVKDGLTVFSKWCEDQLNEMMTEGHSTTGNGVYSGNN